MVAVLPSGRRLPLQASRAIPREPGGKDDGRLAWTAPFTLPDGGKGRLELRSVEDAASIHYAVSVAADTNLDVDAIEFVLDIPRAEFLNGRFTPDAAPDVPELAPADQAARLVFFPRQGNDITSARCRERPSG